jgi:hypothetical protein
MTLSRDTFLESALIFDDIISVQDQSYERDDMSERLLSWTNRLRQILEADYGRGIDDLRRHDNIVQLPGAVVRAISSCALCIDVHTVHRARNPGKRRPGTTGSGFIIFWLKNRNFFLIRREAVVKKDFTTLLNQWSLRGQGFWTPNLQQIFLHINCQQGYCMAMNSS